MVLKDDLVSRVKALPSRAQGAAIIQSFELDRVCVQSALSPSSAEAARWAAARRLSGRRAERLLRAGLLPPPLPRRRYSRLRRGQSRSGY
jgi:hypothetical protein